MERDKPVNCIAIQSGYLVQRHQKFFLVKTIFFRHLFKGLMAVFIFFRKELSHENVSQIFSSNDQRSQNV